MKPQIREGEELRPVDLARLAGVSSQQIRNYEDAGVLPPARRTPGDHRRYTCRHRDALLAYRGLVAGYGPIVAGEVMRAVHAGDVAGAVERVDAAHAALHEQRRSLRAAGEALEVMARQALPDLPPAARRDMRVGEVARLLGVRPSALRVWEEAGLLHPERDAATGYRRYGPADIRDARMIAVLRQSRYLLDQIRPVLDGLRRTGDSDALRAAIARRLDGITRRAVAMLEGAGLLHRYLALHGPAPHTRTEVGAAEG
ncbi:DNA-binding transcriptional regulator, MerR family [Marinactinospora thermotolerans DSM 45154]|uniref:DNA-binding transcriptional regulator, MerR family n=1 Tax=Marinactinospora thermotolerans DSM 45154 TaxID=1122192 RepID=A0A1T4PHC8_9ACTN|nr:MerR family transcriptional regulator [Marinactinospora thermotolerans]SJZ90909.1 DNA-binding transcriptional regulator, MerR family [Marinactinospora thermotolerans DSM 45154]